jgi:uncharacterized membrane protein YccF (DUF307 family)
LHIRLHEPSHSLIMDQVVLLMDLKAKHKTSGVANVTIIFVPINLTRLSLSRVCVCACVRVCVCERERERERELWLKIMHGAPLFCTFGSI